MCKLYLYFIFIAKIISIVTFKRKRDIVRETVKREGFYSSFCFCEVLAQGRATEDCNSPVALILFLVPSWNQFGFICDKLTSIKKSALDYVKICQYCSTAIAMSGIYFHVPFDKLACSNKRNTLRTCQ